MSPPAPHGRVEVERMKAAIREFADERWPARDAESASALLRAYGELAVETMPEVIGRAAQQAERDRRS